MAFSNRCCPVLGQLHLMRDAGVPACRHDAHASHRARGGPAATNMPYARPATRSAERSALSRVKTSNDDLLAPKKPPRDIHSWSCTKVRSRKA